MLSQLSTILCLLRQLLCCLNQDSGDLSQQPSLDDSVASDQPPWYTKALPPLPSTLTGDGGKLRKGLGIAKIALDVADGLSKAFPPLEGAVGFLNKVVSFAERYLENEDSMKGIQERMIDIETVLQRARQRDSSTELPSQSRIFLENKLKNASESIDRIERTHPVGKFVGGSEVATKIKKCLNEVEEALNRYHFSLTQDIRDTQLKQDDLYRLDKLRTMTVPDAVFRKELPGCLYGTRRGLLEELRQWASDRSEPQVYWLHGHAGSGKSTIAQSFAAALSSQGDLGASFFCSRKLRDGSNTRRILPTLSHQLSVTSTVFRKALLRELKADESFATSVSLAVQLKHLVVIPALYVQCSTVILIDALCECADNQSVLFLLSHLVQALSRAPSIKLFITSRNELHIERSLTSLTRIKIQSLHMVNGVKSDVKLFIKMELARIATERKDVKLPDDWPAEEKTNALAARAEGSFIFASTTVKAIKSEGYDPIVRLNHFIDTTTNGRRPASIGEHAMQHDSLYAELDKFYLTILKDRFPPQDKAKSSHLRMILGLLVVACDPQALTLTMIAEILPITRNTIFAILRLLHSVLLVPDHQESTITFYHRSFLEFLADAQRRKDPRFHIDVSEQHLNAFRYCFDTMHKQYRVKPKNICNLPRYSNNNILPVADRDRCVSQANKYSCRHWADHLLADGRRDDHLSITADLLIPFFKTVQLWWFEVHSLLGKLQVAINALDGVYKWLSSLEMDLIGNYEQLVQLTYEGKRFVSFARDAIEGSAAHLYHSALPFSPTNLMCWQTANTLVAEPRIIIGAGEFWADGSDNGRAVLNTPYAQLRVVGTNHSTAEITFAHFSLDGKLIVAGSEDKTTRIWTVPDTNIAAEPVEIPPTVLPYSSVCHGGTFLPDDTYVVCHAEDDSLILWDRKRRKLCDRDTAARKAHGRFGQLFPSGAHRPLGFFSSHRQLQDDGRSYRWKLCYWEVVQEKSEDIGKTHSKSNGSATVPRLRLFAQGALPVKGGYGVTRIQHEPNPDTAGSVIIVERFKKGWQSVATMTPVSHEAVVQDLSFREDTSRAVKPIDVLDSYIGLEKPCIQSEVWVMDERGRQILWMPLMHRGRGRWWKKKLLLEGKSGRISLLDFLDVDLRDDRSPF